MPEENQRGWTANEYLRVSKDKSGRERSPGEQHDHHEGTRDERRWRLGKIYRDIGSASRFARKPRGDFAKLIKDLETDQFGAQVLMLWDTDRGSRRESEWLRLIELCEEKSVLIWVATHRRLYDCSIRRDRKQLLEDAIEAADYSAKLSESVRRGIDSSAVAGEPHGRIPYGYARVYDERSGRLIAQVAHEVEAPVVVELFERWVKGEALNTIARDFEARGIEKRSGGPFVPMHLRSMLLNPTYAGTRVHDPERGTRGHRIGDGAKTYPAKWPAIIKTRVWHRAQNRLNDPSRRSHTGPRPGAAKHFLSMIARCGRCGDVIVVKTAKAGPAYGCRSPKGCTLVSKADLDELAERYILTWLADPAQYRALAQADDAHDAELAAVQADLEKARGDLLELARRTGTGELTFEFAAMSEPGIRERITRLEEREQVLSVPSALSGLIEPGPDVARRWNAAPITTRREIARKLLVPELLGELRVLPVGRVGRRKVPVQDRVVFHKG